MDIQIAPADFAAPTHRQGVVDLLASYADSPAGGSAGIPDAARRGVVAMLEATPTAVTLLAFAGPATPDATPVGLASCVLSFSTFRAKPLLNLHDLVVGPSLRGQGVGSRLLEAVEAEARRRGCCAVTLEVVGENTSAQRLYRRMGFQGGDSISPPTATMFWKKPLD